ncbi:MAG: DUF2125 domain-containing protein [Burkholderiales bacterium]|nr:DUF2125 domain-containing protein [Burkholderiales bacterium]
MWLRGQAEQRMDATALSLKSRGYDLSWEARAFSGYPFRMDVRLVNARVAEPSGWALRAPEHLGGGREPGLHTGGRGRAVPAAVGGGAAAAHPPRTRRPGRDLLRGQEGQGPLHRPAGPHRRRPHRRPDLGFQDQQDQRPARGQLGRCGGRLVRRGRDPDRAAGPAERRRGPAGRQVRGPDRRRRRPPAGRVGRHGP